MKSEPEIRFAAPLIVVLMWIALIATLLFLYKVVL